MAVKYLWSGSNASPAQDGNTWATAYTKLSQAAAALAAGDTLYVAHDHSETTAAIQIVTFPGTVAAPNLIFCVNRTASPSDSQLATTAQVATTGVSGITFGGNFYMYGVIMTVGSAGNAGSIITTNGANNLRQFFENCDFILNNTSSGSEIAVSLGTQHWGMKNCRFRFGGTGQRITPRGFLHIQGGSFIPGTTSPTFVFNNSTTSARTVVDGFDFSALAATVDMFQGGGTFMTGKHILRNCKMPANWSGDLYNAVLTVNEIRAEMWNCDSADTNYRMWIEDLAGSIKSDTQLIKTGGASDGDQGISWKMASTADAEFPHNVLRSPEIFTERIATRGVQKTATIDIVHGSAADLKDDEIWLEAQYPGQVGSPQAWLPSSFADDKRPPIGIGQAQAASTASWTEGSPINRKQKLEVTFTPQAEGPVILTVCLARASTTVYVDPLATIT